MHAVSDRGIGGINVRLFWDEAAVSGTDIVLEYEDLNEDVTYVLHPPRERALDAFYHPNAYLDVELQTAA
jgi:hypothetical protein